MNLVNVLGGIISSAPEAAHLWKQVAPLIAEHASVSESHLTALQPLIEKAHAAVQAWHDMLAKASEEAASVHPVPPKA